MVLIYTDPVRSAEHKAIVLTLANQLDTAYNRQQARMWSQILLGCFLVLVTTIVHMFATAAVLVMLKKMGRLLHMNKASTLQRTLLVASLVACMFRPCVSSWITGCRGCSATSTPPGDPVRLRCSSSRSSDATSYKVDMGDPRAPARRPFGGTMGVRTLEWPFQSAPFAWWP